MSCVYGNTRGEDSAVVRAGGNMGAGPHNAVIQLATCGYYGVLPHHAILPYFSQGRDAGGGVNALAVR